MNLALDWMLENSKSSDAVICSDSQSLVICQTSLVNTPTFQGTI